jgi:hypothetical protein
LTALFLAVGGNAVGQEPPPDGREASFTMSISLAEKTVKPGSEVWGIVDLTNTSAERLWLWRPRTGAPVYTVEVVDRAGKAVPMTAMGRALRKGDRTYASEKGGPMRSLGANTGSSVGIEPGDTVKDAIAIQQQVDLSQPGEYTIRLERVDPATKVAVKSNTVTLKVVGDPPAPK